MLFSSPFELTVSTAVHVAVAVCCSVDWRLELVFEFAGDASRQVIKVEALLNDCEKLHPEMMVKLKKENHVPREKKPPRGECRSGR